VIRERWDLPERKETKERLVLTVYLDWMELMALMDLREKREKLEHRVCLVLLELKEPVARLGLRGLKVHKESLVLTVRMEPPVNREKRENQGCQLLDPREKGDLPEQMENPAPMVLLVLTVNLSRESPVFQGCLVLLD